MNDLENTFVEQAEILIVDDTKANLELLVEILHTGGYKARPANSGELALRSVKARHPDLILLDVKLPGIDGYEVCRQLKTDENTRSIPVIFISVLEDETSKVKGFDAGGIDFISKPFHPKEVLSRVGSHLSIRQMQQKLELQNELLKEEISSRKLAEEALSKSAELFRATLYSIGDGVITTDNNGCITHINPVAQTLTGWTEDEAIGIKLNEVFNIINEDTRHKVASPVDIVLREGTIVGLANHTLLIAKDLTERPIADSGAPIINDKGEVSGVVLVFRDQSSERETERALVESEEKFRTLFDNANEGIMGADAQLYVTYVNQKMADMLGYKVDELIGMPYTNLILPEEVGIVLDIEKERNDGKFGTYERRLIRKDKSIIWTLVSSSPKFSHEGTYEGSIGMFTGITDRVMAQEALQESEATYRTLIEKMPDGVYKSTHDGKFIDMNPAMVRMLGYDSKEELLAVDIKRQLYFSPDERESLTLDEINEELGEFRMRKKDGSEIWVEDHGWYTQDETGTTLYHEGVIRDVSERRLADQKLRQASANWHKTFNAIQDAIVLLDAEQRIVMSNKAFSKLQHSENSSLFHQKCFCLVHKSQCPVDGCPFRKAAVSRQRETMEIAIDEGVFQILVDPIFDDEGKLTGAVHIMSDISRQKKAEIALMESEERQNTFINTNVDMMFVKDDQFRYVLANKAMADFFGKTKEELINRTDFELAEKSKIYPCISSDQKALHTVSVFTVEEQLGDRFYETTKFPLRLKGNKKGIGGIIRDVTERKQAAEALRKSEEMYRILIEKMPDGVYKTTHDGHIIDVNPAMIKILGFENKEEMIGIDIANELYFDPKEREIKTIEGLNNELILYRLRKKDGREVWVEDHGWYTYDDAGQIVFHEGVIRDVSDRRKHETQIKTLGKAIEQSPVSIVITDESGNIEFVNDEFVSLTQYSLNDVKGRKPIIFNPGHLEPGAFKNMWDTLLSGSTWKGEFANRKKDGTPLFEEVAISGMQDPYGKISNFILVMEDITEKKRILDDLVVARDAAEESDRLKTAFLHNISHEIRTPMNAIVGFAEYLNEPDTLPHERRKFAEIIVNSSHQLLSIITDIVSMATIEAGQEKLFENPVNLNDLCTMVYEQFLMKSPNPHVKLRYSTPLPYHEALITTDEIKLSQVLTNLIGNALKFTMKGTVEFGYALHENTLEFYVRDSGIGIAPELHDEIFKRFRQVETTSTRLFGGSGLGLSISKAYVELLGGKIWLRSASGEGSTFYFTIPYVKGDADALTEMPQQTIDRLNQSKTILVAEDEDSNFTLMEVIFLDTPMKVIRAKTGLEAVAQCVANPQIDLVLMDIKMPEMDGYEATKRIREFLPELPIIALTAYNALADKNKALECGCNDFISKPFKRNVLMAKIKELIQV
ncbi:MAG: PAS domain S-box protein [Bacteroidales bacterium]|nr:PAS domain S-box protein [Bacteroidales bacterium]